MTSPVGSRRRQRSTRIVVAVLLLVLAAAAVVGTTVSGSWFAVTIAADLAVLLGVVATKITHSDLMASRRQAARDRAHQAQAYRELTEARTAEHLAFATEMQGRLARREATVVRLEKRLGETAQELADARRHLVAAEDRAGAAEAESERLGNRLADAEERAASAVIRVAELEQEVDVLTVRWQEAQALAEQRTRKLA